MAKLNPIVSIIVPSYNHSKYLKQRLNSIFNQSFQDYEVLLLDDASTDDSVFILRQYANHPKVSQFIINSKNSGSPFKQWQKGINLAKGEIIWIAESDDWADILFLEKLVPFFKNPETGIVCCNFNVILPKEKSLLISDSWKKKLDAKKWNEDYFEYGIYEIKNYLCYTNTIGNASSVLFSKKFVSKDYHFSSFEYCGDWFFWIDILTKSNIYYSAIPLSYYRWHSLSVSGIRNNLMDEIKRINEWHKVLDFCEEVLNERINRKSSNYTWMINRWCSYFRTEYLNPYFYLPPFSVSFFPYFYKRLFSIILNKIYRFISND